MLKIKSKKLKYFLSLVLVGALVLSYFLFLDKDRASLAQASYLHLTETSDYFHVQSDVFGLRLYKASTDGFIYFYDKDGNEIGTGANGGVKVETSDSVSYEFRYDVNRSSEIIENNKNRIVIHFSGKFNDAYGGGGNYLSDGSNDAVVDLYYYIYSDYFTVKIDFDAYEGIDIRDTYSTYFFYIRQSNGYFDSGERYYGTTTGEALASSYGHYESAEYGAILATSTPDWQVVELSENHSGTSTQSFSFATEATYQDLAPAYASGNLKRVEAVYAIRPKINTTEAERIAWVAQMIASDEPTMITGSYVQDSDNEIFEPFNSDGSYHLRADDNKLKFNLHGEADASALISATTTGRDTSLSFSNDTGLFDPGGTSTHWAQIGNRLPYGSFDKNDPDVLFYWDMDSISDGQAPNKGIGPIGIYYDIATTTGVAGDGLSLPSAWDSVSINNKNFNPEKGSIAFWYKNASSTAFTIQDLLFHGDNNLERQELSFVFDVDDNQLGLKLNNVSIFYNYSLNDYVNLADQNWHFIRLDYNSIDDLTRVFIDGALVIESSVSFPPLELFKDVRILKNDGELRLYSMDELYISSDPNQPDAPSYYDVISYTDKTSNTLTGIPESGAGSLRWNYPPGSPIVETTKQDPVFTVHDWSPKSASSTGELVDHLVLDLPLDGLGKNENSRKVYDKVSGDWIGTTTEGVSFVDGVEGNGARFHYENPSEKIGVSSSYIGSKGTIEFDYKYNGYDAWNKFFGTENLNQFEFFGNNSDVLMSFQINYSEVDFDLDISLADGEWHKFQLSWDDDSDLRKVYLDGRLMLSTSTLFTMPNFEELQIANSDDNRVLNGSLDNFRIYNDVILPYGAYYTGKDQNGSYAKAHPDLLFYWDADSAVSGVSAQISTSTVTQTGITTTAGVHGNAIVIDSETDKAYFSIDDNNFNPARGKIGFWFKPTYDISTTTGAYHVFGDDRSSSNPNEFNFWSETNGNYNFQILDNASASHVVYIYHQNVENYLSQNKWSYIELLWDDTNPVDGDYYQAIKINGELIVPDGVSGQTAWNNDRYVPYDYGSGDKRMYIGGWSYSNTYEAQGYYDEIYISNSPDTPYIPTAFGKPLIVPQLSIVSGADTTLKQVKTDYEVSMLNDITSYLVRYNSDVSSETTFLISESLNLNSTDYDYNMERNAPLLSTSYTTDYATITVQRGDASWGDDFKLVFSESDAGVSSCYIGQGTSGSWGDNLCSATDMLSELDQNSVEQEAQTSELNIIQNTAMEVIIQNTFVLTGEATSTETWHIFSDGSVIKDIEYEKANANLEARTINSEFSNYAYYPSAPSTSRGAGTYHDSFFIHLTRASTDLTDDYQSPSKTINSFGATGYDYIDDINSDGFAESYGAHPMSANYAGDFKESSSSATKIYHTIGTSTSIINVTTSVVNEITTDTWLIKFSGSPDLSYIHKRDKFKDGAGTQIDWNIISVNDSEDEIIVGDQEKNGGSPSALNTNQATVGPWYTSLFDWEATENRDLTSIARYANGEIEMAECWPTLDTTSVKVSNWTTSQNNFIHIYTPISQRHKGVWTEDSYIMQPSTSYCILNYEDIWIDGIQCQQSDLTGIRSINQSGMILKISNSIFRGSSTPVDYRHAISSVSSNPGAIYKIWNNIIYNWKGSDSSGVEIYDPGILAYVYNNVIFNNTRGIRARDGITVAKNNIVNNCDSDYVGSNFSDDSDYNISEDGTAPGDNSKTCTVSFVSTSTEDFHLVSDDTCARKSGWNLSADPNLSFSSDIDGQERSAYYGNWDIGADQIFEPSNKTSFELVPTDTAYKPRFLIEDWYPRSGKSGSAEGYIVAHLKADRLVNTEYLYDEISGSSTIFKVNNYANVDFPNSVRGKGIRISDNDAASIQFNTSLINLKSGSISMVYTPDSDTVDDNKYFFNFIDDFNNIRFMAYRDYSDNIIFLCHGIAGINVHMHNDCKKGIPVNMRFTWKTIGDYNYNCMFINDRKECTVTSKITSINQIGVIGNYNQSGGWEVEGILDDIKIYSEAILPYGAYYTGYGQNGNYSQADPSVSFYWDMENNNSDIPNDKTATFNSGASLSDSKRINGNHSFKVDRSNCSVASFDIENDNIFDKNKGSIAFWLYPESFSSGQNTLMNAMVDLNNKIVLSLSQSSGDLNIYGRWVASSSSVYCVGSYGDIIANSWNWVRATWDTYKDEFKIFVNGKQSGSTATISDNLVGDIKTLNIGDAECNWIAPWYLDSFYITNNPYSQEIPSAFGKPIRMPMMRFGPSTDLGIQRYGKDYVASFTSDSNIIIQYLKDTAGGVFEISEGGGSARPIRIKGGVRINGGVRF